MSELSDVDRSRAILRRFEEPISRQPIHPKAALQRAVATRVALAASLRRSLEEYERKKASIVH